MYVLPENLRSLLKKPIGIVVNDEKKLLKILKKEKKIVSIGDQVTFTLLKNNIEPFFCVVDYNTRRGECSEEIVKILESYGKKTIKVCNPAGTITDELWNVIKVAYECNDQTLKIEVTGEEDLASLAAIYMAPLDVTIIYGLPDKGVLVVKPTKENKDKVKKVLDKM
jgi:GTP-dependent dephospho-CoA kinase